LSPPFLLWSSRLIHNIVDLQPVVNLKASTAQDEGGYTISGMKQKLSIA